MKLLAYLIAISVLLYTSTAFALLQQFWQMHRAQDAHNDMLQAAIEGSHDAQYQMVVCLLSGQYAKKTRQKPGNGYA